jgi:hypothetical protein
MGDKGARREAKYLKNHIDSNGFPSGSFARIEGGPYVSSPELCFMQMATELSLIELIQFGYELCGRYRMIANKATGQGFCEAAPLTDSDKLGRYVARASGIRGRENALLAIRHILDNSASPMETILAMMLTLPHRLGGYALPKPELNSRIKVATNARYATSKGSYECDMFWPDRQLAVEYDSDSYHTKESQIADNAKKRTALSRQGIEVITVTKRQLVNTADLRNIAGTLAVKLDKRLRIPVRKFAKAHDQLRKRLLPRVSDR